tara:strand:- start:3468 stop:3629 length:162 start_codon:yes stop_codon:yes gene_type:complete
MKTTEIVNGLLNFRFTKTDLALELGISRPTLDARIKDHSWKKSEVVMVRFINE